MTELEATALAGAILFVLIWLGWKLFGKQLENNQLRERIADLEREKAKGKEGDDA